MTVQQKMMAWCRILDLSLGELLISVLFFSWWSFKITLHNFFSCFINALGTESCLICHA